MASIGIVNRNKKRVEMEKKYRDRRNKLKSIMKSKTVSMKEKVEAARKLNSLPVKSFSTRTALRCEITGRPRAIVKQFGLCRIKFREFALAGYLPGIKKASW
ncbi:30S ribosomal protein S14 [Candidatus Nesciobacter abundans]|uniref:Small ribosomal subunit protein uS14 n=1 Tax=Candidatus Nesciobacter abundans TaxID=2601668 RepID=A0A5C0UJD2_9PROT|nr:30S ribosomal protein S14 [Candidatus Nesciobacter abundans]QEK38914.1 30S ribosomal protein S14 [Candidatus Nesciobacter abundans]